MARRTRRRQRRSRRTRRRQRGGMQSPVYRAHFGGVPLVDQQQQAVVFRSTDPADPHGAPKALMSIGDVANEYSQFEPDPTI